MALKMHAMKDLNDLRVFERVALLGSFSGAAKVLGMPKSSVSRSIGRLEAELGTRLFQRNTRDVVLTAPGTALLERCAAILDRVVETMDYFNGLGDAPRGRLRVTAGMGFGVNVLAGLIPGFLQAHPQVDVWLDLSTHHADLIAAQVDVAVRLGPMADSRLVARKLGAMQRFLCASPAYLERHPAPAEPADLAGHAVVEMPGVDGRPRAWTLTRNGDTRTVELQPRVEVNEALAIHRLVLNGAGIGCVSGYLCAPDFEAGRLVRLLPGWTLPAVEVNAVFPSSRSLSPLVRAFVDYLAAHSRPGEGWQVEPL